MVGFCPSTGCLSEPVPSTVAEDRGALVINLLKSMLWPFLWVTLSWDFRPTGIDCSTSTVSNKLSQHCTIPLTAKLLSLTPSAVDWVLD